MADNAPALNGLSAVHTALQAPRVDESAAAAADFKVTAPWSFLPSQATHIFSSLAEGAFGAPTPTADYEKKVFEWLPPTPSGDTTTVPAAGAWATNGLPRPQPHKPQELAGAANGVIVQFPAAGSPKRQSSESPIDVVSTSAFAPAKDEGAPEIARPQPLRPEAASSAAVNPLLILASDQQPQQPIVTLASAFGLPQDSAIMSTSEQPGPSNEQQQPANVSPPSRGCYTRAPGLGPPPETPTSGNGQTSAYVCAVCGFSCASKFHYNSHMNTHGDHQCSMCDYTSRTEGRLKKHMRDSHTVEEQMAAGLELTPAAATVSSANNSPVKEDEEMAQEPAQPASALGLPSSLSSTLLGMIATSTASSMSSALEQMRAITEQPLLGDGSADGLLLVGAPHLGLGLPLRDDTPGGIGAGGGGGGGGGNRRKQKQLRCKQCPHISLNKDEQWEHARSHIPTDKQMSCDKCNFVTEYKHHLEYHQRNHAGIKPFQCKKCSYTCVNKSMLNSHMKSHSNVYQYRCADCNYATKYCHSLKLHLKKYAHRRNTEGLTEAELLQTMSAESSPPTLRKDSTASIASSISGPFTPFGLLKREEPTTPLATPQMPSFSLPTSSPSLLYATQSLLRQHQFEQMLQAQQQNQQAVLAHKCNQCDFSTGSHEELIRHNVAHMLSNSNLFQALGVQASLAIPDRSAEDDHHTTTGSPSGDDAVSHSNESAGSPLGSEGEGGASRRKSAKPTRIAIDDIGQQLMDKASPDTVIRKVEVKQEEMDTSEEPASATVDITASSEQLVLPAPQPMLPSAAQLQLQLAAMQQQQQAQQQQQEEAAAAAAGLPHMTSLRQAYLAHLAGMTRAHSGELFSHECTHCKMGFMDRNIHTIHMSYHHPEHPMTCSRCSYVCANPLLFNLHLLQSAHH